VRKRSFLANTGLIGAIALLALIANGLLNNRVPAAWIFAIAIFGRRLMQKFGIGGDGGEAGGVRWMDALGVAIGN
jgi:hypothetical protein